MSFTGFLRSASAAALLAFALPGADARAVEKVKMSFAEVQANYVTYIAAIEKGYFREEGFEIEMVLAGGGVATPALISGDLEFNTSGSSALSAILKGAPLKLLYFPWNRLPYQVWSTTPDIKTIADIKGKTIGIQTRGDTFEVGMRVALMKSGLDPNAVSFTPLGFGAGRFAAISSGSLPVVILTRVETAQLRVSGTAPKGHLLYDMFDNIQMPYTGVAIADANIKKDRERIKRFVRASIKGHYYAAAFREESISMLMKYNPKRDRRAMSTEYDEIIASRTVDGTITDELQRLDTDVRAQLVNVAKDKIRPLTEIYDFSMAHEVNRDLKAAGWKPSR
ncbi:MAG: ABC transporter substrate-binding protein [Betaproteobacteria bacterium]|nr:ABC transporter substrate-binding protein [Betaproteobacteria bacterium]